ncbi:MAG: hypothetical protein U0939_25895 [Pirellulales bacterium]
MISPDPTWNAIGVSEQELRTFAERLGDPNNLPPLVHRFFEQASSLMLHAWYRYSFASIAFFHAVIGVEKILRLAYDAEQKDSFAQLFDKAVEQRIIHDGVFQEIEPIGNGFLRKQLEEFLKERRKGKDAPSYPARLASLVPHLRNEYLHGKYLMALAFVPLSLQMRQVADAIAASRHMDKALKPHVWLG